MSNMQIDSVLAQIRSLQAQTKISAPSIAKPDAATSQVSAGGRFADRVSFANVLKQGLEARERHAERRPPTSPRGSSGASRAWNSRR